MARATSSFPVPVSPLIGWTGATNLVLAPFGCFGMNLAAITAAICTGPQAHPDRERRFLAGVWAGVFYLVVGVFGATVAALLVALPPALIAAIAGLGLLGTIGLQARSYSALADSAMRAEATLAADRLVGIMNNDVANLAAYQAAPDAAAPVALAAWAAETSAAIPGARYRVAVVPEPARTRVEIEIHWQRKRGDAASRHLVTAYIR